MKHSHISSVLAITFAVLLPSFTSNSAAQSPPTNHLALWLKADQGVNITPPTVTTPVYGWADQAAGGLHHASLLPKSVLSLQGATFPNGQHPVIHFNGTGGFTLSGSADFQVPNVSIYVVASVDTTLPSKCIFTVYEDGQDGFPISGWALGISDSVAGLVKWFAVDPNPDTLQPLPGGKLVNHTPTLITGTFDSDSGIKVLYINSTQVGTETGLGPIYYSGHEVTTVGYLIPNSRPRQQLVGDIAEILVFNGVDETQRTGVEAYLTAKYFQPNPPAGGAPPTDGMICWLKADAGVDTNAPSATTPVYGWSDQAPGSTRFGTPRGEPAMARVAFPNGTTQPVIRLNGSSGFALDNSAALQTPNLSVYVVTKVDTSTTGKGILTCYNDSQQAAAMGGWAVGIDDASAGVVKWFSANPDPDTVSSGAPLKNQQPTLITATFDGNTGNKNLYTNSVLAGSETGVAAIFYSGREVLALGYLTPFGQQLVGDIAEIIAYDTVDDTQRSSVEAYLKAKYFVSAAAMTPPTNNMVLWFKADAGVDYKAPAPVAGWTNQASGGLHSATPNTTTPAPTLAQAPFPNGQHPVIRFSGTGGFNLDHPDTQMQEVSVYVVGRFDASVTKSQDFIGNGSDNGGGWGLGVDDGTSGFVKWWTSTGTYESCPIDSTTPAYITATVSSITGLKALFLNSENLATDGDVTTLEYNPTTVGLSVGQYNNFPSVHSQYMYGDLAEMLVFSTVDSAQQSAVESYFQKKYFQPNPDLIATPPAANLVIWLRADAGVNTNATVGPQRVYDWYDQAPAMQHSATATFAGGGNPTLTTAAFPNGQHSVVYFNGSCGFLLAHSAGLQLTNLSLYMVGSASATLTGRSILACYEDSLDGYDVGGWIFGIDDSTAGLVKWFSCNPDPDTLSPDAAALTEETPALITATLDSRAGVKALYLNSAQVGVETGLGPIFYSGNEVATLGWLVPVAGPRQVAVCNIAELMLYDSVDTNQQAAVESYLHQKYFVAVQPAPTLGYQVNASQLTLSWTGTGFILQQNGEVSKAAGWTDVTGATTSPAVLPINATAQFFRLRKQ